jgi:hypothetical protein
MKGSRAHAARRACAEAEARVCACACVGACVRGRRAWGVRARRRPSRPCCVGRRCRDRRLLHAWRRRTLSRALSAVRTARRTGSWSAQRTWAAPHAPDHAAGRSAERGKRARGGDVKSKTRQQKTEEDRRKPGPPRARSPAGAKRPPPRPQRAPPRAAAHTHARARAARQQQRARGAAALRHAPRKRDSHTSVPQRAAARRPPPFAHHIVRLPDGERQPVRRPADDGVRGGVGHQVERLVQKRRHLRDRTAADADAQTAEETSVRA